MNLFLTSLQRKSIPQGSLAALIPLLMIFTLASCGSADTKISPTEKKAELFYTQGTRKLVSKEYTEALDYLLKAHAIHPENSKINNNLGMAYFFKNKKDKAFQHLQEALDLDEKNSDARINLASLYYRFGEYEKASKEYLKVLEDLIYKHQHRVYYGLALISLKQKRPLEARKHLQKAIEQKDDYCAAHFKLGELAKKAYHYSEAYKRFQLASQGTCFQEPEPHYEQALTLMQMRDFRKANIKLKEIIQMFPRTIYANMAQEEMEKLKKMIYTESQFGKQEKQLRSPAF